MSNQPSTLSRPVKIGLAVLCLLIMAYSLVIAGQILLGVIACGFVVAVALSVRLLAAVFRFVDAVERGADALEAIADDGTGSSRRGEGDPSGRGAERDRSREHGRHPDDRW